MLDRSQGTDQLKRPGSRGDASDACYETVCGYDYVL